MSFISMINNKENYDQMFGKSQGFAYGKPHLIVEKIPDYLDSGSALDLGAGDGRHSILLASNGFKVKAIDTSKVALDKLKRFAEEQGVPVETLEADLSSWTIDQDYDVIVAYNILQHLNTFDALRVLQEMKERTRPNGLNAVSLFTSTGDRFLLDRLDDPDAFYPKDLWLKESYQDWEILFYEESEGTLIGKVRDDGTSMKNVVSKILARKPSE